MKYFHFILLCAVSQIQMSCTKESSKKDNIIENESNHILMTGDIIFQTSLSEQSKAIQYATNSAYTHCGIIYKNGKDYLVLEAVQPVKLTPLTEWIKNGEDEHFVIKRLKNSKEILNNDVLIEMENLGRKYIGKNYDLTFEWSDDKMYCSEIIWKIYQETTGLEIGKLQKLKEFNLNHSIVKEKLSERYGDKIPLEETVISPQAIFESQFLETFVSQN